MKLGYIENAEFRGTHSIERVEVKCDTGAKRTSICRSLADKIGVGDPVKTVTVHSSNGSQEREVYELDVCVGGETHSALISVTDREGMNYDAILGRDILESFLIDSGEKFLSNVNEC